MVCLVNRKEAENKEEIRAARSPRGFSNLDFKNEGSKSAQSHLINEIETDSIDLSRLDQTFLRNDRCPQQAPPTTANKKLWHRGSDVTIQELA